MSSIGPDHAPDWTNERDRVDWIEGLLRDSSRSHFKTNESPAYDYQRHQAGAPEIRLFSRTEDPIWCDGIHVDSDGVIAVDAKYVGKPDRSPHAGRMAMPPGAQERYNREFDYEIERYVAVLRDPENPVERLRIITNNEHSAEYLGARARNVMGRDAERLDVRIDTSIGLPAREPIGLQAARQRLRDQRELDTAPVQGTPSRAPGDAERIRQKNLARMQRAEQLSNRGRDDDRERGR